MSDPESTGAEVITLGEYAIGAIGPLEAGADPSVVERTIAAVNDEANWKRAKNAAPYRCIDGRPDANGNYASGTCSSGGTETVAVALALVGDVDPRHDAAQHTSAVAIDMHEHGEKIGGHTADHHGPGGSGCGACDQLDTAFKIIADAEPKVQKVLKGIGVEIDDETNAAHAGQARMLLDRGFTRSSGEQVVAAIGDAGGEIVPLSGPHREVVVVLNMQPLTELDRNKVAEQVGGQAQVFVVDVWALKNVAERLAPHDPAKINRLFTAMLYYNVAVALALCGPSLRVITH